MNVITAMNRLNLATCVFFLFMFLVIPVLAGNNSGGAFSTWPDTGQTKCYNDSAEIPCPAPGEPFYGQDAQYTGPARSYTLLGGGTMVQDNVTGLIWEMKSDRDGIKNYSNPNDADNTYTWCDPNPVTNGGDQGTCGTNDTKGFIDQLNSENFGGYADWRLPTMQELTSLVDNGRWGPAIDPIFRATTMSQYSYYWSSTTDIDYNTAAWAIISDYGIEESPLKYGNVYVRAVRGGRNPPEFRFVDNSDGTVTDTVTCLQWQNTMMDTDGVTGADEYTWSEALTVCENLSLAGHDDWRLPDKNELRSIANYSRIESAIDPIFAATTTSKYYWSSTTMFWGLSRAWPFNFHDGGFNHNDTKKSYTFGVRAVRGEQCGGLGTLLASLQGTVSEKDMHSNSLGLLSGATVSLSGRGSMTTGSLGNYRFENLQAGTYTVTVSKIGFYPVTRQVMVSSGNVQTESFSLTPELVPSTLGPQAFDFKTSTSPYVIDNMPGDMHFSTQVAWNGSPGSVRFKVADQWQPATVTDQGDGTAMAELTLTAPLTINTCSELTLEVTNGEGKRKYVNLGVHFLSTGGMIPWYRDNISWTPSGASLSYPDGWSFSVDLPTEDAGLELSLSAGYDREIKYDLFGASFSGSLTGSGSLDFSLPLPNPKVSLIGEGGISSEGNLQVSLAGCGTPEISSSWSFNWNRSAGLNAPAVLALDFVAPGTGTFLAQIPGIDKIKLQLLLKAQGGISGEYENFSGDCFLGSTGLVGSVGGGLEGTALVEFGKKFETGVYVGGDGTFGFGLCPDFSFDSYTGTVYAGAYAELYGFEAHKEIAAEIVWNFTDDAFAPKVLALTDINKSTAAPLWQPIGSNLEQWGEMNQLTEFSTMPKTPALMGMDLTDTGTEEVKVVENVIGLAAPSVFSDSLESLILYAHHDTNKPWYAATDIGSIVSDGNGGWTSGLVTDDQAAEFYPDLTDIGNNQLLATWTRVAGDISTAVAPEDVAPHLEIVASRYDTIAKTWTSPEQLTTNNIVDRDSLPVVAGGRQGIVWIQNQGDKLVGDSTSGDSLLYREWSGTSWSTPTVLYAAPKGILEFTFTSDSSGEASIVFTVDEDGDSETKTDRELCMLATVSGVWQAAIRLTNDSVEDSLPVLTDPNGVPMLVWKADETLQYTALSSWNAVPVYSQTTLAGEAPTLDGTTMPGGAAIAYTIQGENGIDIVAAFYDASLNIWSQPIQLSNDEHAESSISLIFNGTELVMSYLKTQTLRQDIEVELNGQIQTISNVPQPGRTDLYVLRHTLGRDLAVAVDSLKTAPVNPAPGGTTTITAKVANIGDIAVGDIPVSFYDGYPENGGTLIGETTTTGTLIAGTSQDVTMAWQLPQGSTPHNVFVVIDPALTIEDRNRANNITSIVTSLPDLMVTSTKSDQITSDTLALTARISNIGAIPSGTFVVSWRLNSVDGPEIAMATGDDVLPGAYNEVTGQWVAGISTHADDYAAVHVVVDTAGSVMELNEDNNTGLQSIHLPYPSGSLAVTIVPPEAVAAGVQWSIDGGVTWYDSSTQIILPAGTYNIIFKPMPGYTLPSINNVTVQGAQINSVTGDQLLAGDMNGDSTVDLIDAIITLKVINGINSPLGQWYDVNGDQMIGLEEAIHTLQIAGAITQP